MRDSSVQKRFEDILTRVRQPARLIGGETGAGAGFSSHPDEFRLVLGFPDTYDIGISNQAVQILYHVAGRVESVGVERTYLPWVDAIAEMRREDVPLLTAETWSPVGQADLLGVTLQHELGTTNLLEMLDLARIPVRAVDRTEEHPLVLAGGPACANFLPMSRFLDAVAIGDGEETLVEILETLVRARKEGVDRQESKRRLSRIGGVYVPGMSKRVARRTVKSLAEAPYPDEPLVPLAGGVHDRAWVEVMRGCTRGCRFCQAGIWYRPVRERLPQQIVAMTKAQMDSTGYQEVALGSLSTTDYSCLETVLAGIARVDEDVRVSLPSLRVDSAAVKLARLASPTGPSLTLAPEAGSQKMRDMINKNVTEEDILGAAEEAFRAGKTTLKLYFIIGLPWEQDDDVLAIADLCLKIRDIGRSVLGERAGRLRLNISVNNFVPKPFTPFQWCGMADRVTLERRQGLLRSRLKRRGIHVALSDVGKSYLEATLARGGHEMGAVIEEAWMRGARFDSWTEHFEEEAWKAALESSGGSPEASATRAIELDQALPWDLASGVVDRDFLQSEWNKAARGETTPDCRWADCAECGACTAELATDLADDRQGSAARGKGSLGVSESASTAAPTEVTSRTAARVADGDGRRWRYTATFGVVGRGRFLGHLDRAEIFRRAVRRAGGHLALSAGMRPKALLKLALPLAVGLESREELAEFELAEEAGTEFVSRLAESLPEHMPLKAITRYEARRSLAARVIGASYEVFARSASGAPDTAKALKEAAGRFQHSAQVLIEESRPRGAREVDVRQYVDHVRVDQVEEELWALSFRVRVSPSGSLRPERVVEALAGLSGLSLEVDHAQRTRIHLSEAEA